MVLFSRLVSHHKVHDRSSLKAREFMLKFFTINSSKNLYLLKKLCLHYIYYHVFIDC